jgi:hypothetical protein
VAWGAFPGEPLSNVESGIGNVGNLFFIREIQKSVFRTALICSKLIHSPLKEHDLKGTIAIQLGIAGFLLKPGPWSFVVFISGIAFKGKLPPSPKCLLKPGMWSVLAVAAVL